MSVDCALISRALHSVCASYAPCTSNKGARVCNLTLSFNRTASRLYRTSLAPLKPAVIFSAVIDCLKASLKAQRKDSLLTKLMRLHAKAEIQLLYLRFNSAKQLILRSYSKYNKCRGIQQRIIFFLLQRSQKLSELQLLCLLIISSQYVPTALNFI